MRRRRLLWPIVVLALAAIVYVFDDRSEPSRAPVAPRPGVDLRAPGMQMRAAPPEKPTTPSALVPAPPGPVRPPSASDPTPVPPPSPSTPAPTIPPAR